MPEADLPPGADPGEPPFGPDDNWRRPLRSPPPPWSPGTFAAELTRLLRRLAVWHVTDFMSPLQIVRTDSDFWRLTSRTFGEAIQGFNDHPLPGGYRLFGHEEDEPGVCPIPERETDRTATQWLLATYCRRLDAAPSVPAFDYLRSLIHQLLALPTWETLSSDEIGLYGQPPGTRVLSGRPLPESLLNDLGRGVDRLLAIADPAPPAAPPASALPESVHADSAEGKGLTDAESLALRAYDLALRLGQADGGFGPNPTDDEVFDWLIAHQGDDRIKPMLPSSRSSFKRALGRARSRLGIRKRRPPAAATGKSVVMAEDVEPPGREDT